MLPPVQLERCQRHGRGEAAFENDEPAIRARATSGGRVKRGLSKIPTPITSPRDPPSEPHAWADCVRSAVRLELEAFFGERGDVSKALALHGQSPPRSDVVSSQVHRERPSMGRAATMDLDDVESEGPPLASLVADRLGKFATNESCVEVGCGRDGVKTDFFDDGYAGQTVTLWTRLVEKAKACWMMEELQRDGRLAKLVASRQFERTVQILILLNCVIMGIAADYSVRHAPRSTSSDTFERTMVIFDIVFQVAYTVELVLKLTVHRWFFFWNEDASYNVFDLFLVVSGYVDLLFDSGSGSVALRLVRLLKLAKALRALKIVAGFDTLRAILVCIQGSFRTLLWSMLMLYIVFYIFSLIFVQQAAAKIQQIGDREDDLASELLGSFSSVMQSIVTLTKAAFGGEDWGVTYDLLVQCGWVSSSIFMLFVAFTQVALINIITGIFVDSAMQSLMPNREQMAIKLNEEEKAFSEELERLCIAVDADRSGFLTRDQFADGINKGRIPLLLHLLGLDQDHVQNFFEVLCSTTADNQVDIKSFVRGCMRLKGPATSFDLQIAISNIADLERNNAREFRNLKRRIDRIERVDAVDVATSQRISVYVGSSHDPL